MDEKKLQQSDTDIKVLRTYTSDMADVVRTNEMSVIKIALAEKEKRDQEAIYKEAEGTKTSKAFLVIGGIILIIGAITGSYFLIEKKKTNETPQATTTTTIASFILYDSQLKIDTTTTKNVTELIELIKQKSQKNTIGVEAIFLTREANNLTESLTSNNFLFLIEATTPGALKRSLSDVYLLGRYTSQKSPDENNKFLIFQTSDYSLSYKAMLDWEKTMLRDLSVLFDININDLNNQTLGEPWKDILINNKDVRVLYGENGEGILYYVFVNKNNFIIASNIDTLKEIMERVTVKNTNPL